MAELSRLVKRVGDQQKELVIEVSQQLSRHNEMMDKALEKQTRMDQKITLIEDQLMANVSIGYKRKADRIHSLKQVEH